MTSSLPPIITTGSAFSSWLRCNRLRYWQYERLNPDGSHGLERKSLSMPLSTGGWCHKVLQGFLQTTMGVVMQAEAQRVVIETAIQGYLEEVNKHGLELDVDLSDASSEPLLRTIAEQAALIEAFGWAYLRVRLPQLLQEYEVVGVEQEEFTLLSGDVGLQSRCDAILRRKADQRLFIYNLKTSSNPHDSRFEAGFQVNQQIMTETLAVERRLGERVYGVIIDAFDKGSRVRMWWDNLKEIRDDTKPQFEGARKWEGQRNRLLYGYKMDEGVLPGVKAMYDWAGTTKKGWRKFSVWENDFGDAILMQGQTPVEAWVNWLPPEVVQAQFRTLEPIMRNDQAVESKVRQMVSGEQRIRDYHDLVEADESGCALDQYFPQNEHSCVYPSRCPMYDLCHSPGAPENPEAFGFQPRVSNHPLLEVE